MSHEITIRLYDPSADLYALTELINTIQGSKLTMDQVLELISWPGHDLARDRFVAEAGDQLVGMALLFPQSPQRYFVRASMHHNFYRHGIGRALLEQVIAEAKARGATQVTGSCGWNDIQAQLFAEACGFQAAGEVRFFTAPADLSLPEPVLPEGFNLRSIAESGDLHLFAEACNLSYADMWGHYENLQPVTAAKLEDWHGRNPNICPEGMFVLFSSDGRPAGVVRANGDGKGADAARVIDSPGVVPEYRPLGIQKQLVQKAVNWLKDNAKGPYRIETWGDSYEAAKIYARLGFILDETSHSVEFVRYLDKALY